MVNYILARPRESQIKEVAHQIFQLIGAFNIISDPDLRAYLERVRSHIPADQLPDIMARKHHYASRIKGKIRQLIDRYAERRFYEMIKVRKIVSDIMWKFPLYIVPGHAGPPLGKSLYEREGFMNRFETAMITELSSLPQVMFWHRNLGRGRGFSINGYKSDHYPDFILFTHTGKFIVIEAKGDDRDNSDSAAKCKLGNKWAEMAGWDFYYFMIFDSKELEGAYTLEKAKELIKQIK